MSIEPDEQWATIPGLEPYEASTRGNVRHGERRIVLRTQTKRGGYQYVQLNRDGVRTTHALHVLIALAFYGPRPAGYEVDHRNKDVMDNEVRNLRYLPRATNKRQGAATTNRNRDPDPRGHCALGSKRCPICKAWVRRRYYLSRGR